MGRTHHKMIPAPARMAVVAAVVMICFYLPALLLWCLVYVPQLNWNRDAVTTLCNISRHFAFEYYSLDKESYQHDAYIEVTYSALEKPGWCHVQGASNATYLCADGAGAVYKRYTKEIMVVEFIDRSDLEKHLQPLYPLGSYQPCSHQVGQPKDWRWSLYAPEGSPAYVTAVLLFVWGTFGVAVATTVELTMALRRRDIAKRQEERKQAARQRQIQRDTKKQNREREQAAGQRQIRRHIKKIKEKA